MNLEMNGRPVLTPKDVAKQANVSQSTVFRYCINGFWEAVQDETGRWFVYADQPLVSVRRQREIEWVNALPDHQKQYYRKLRNKPAP